MSMATFSPITLVRGLHEYAQDIDNTLAGIRIFKALGGEQLPAKAYERLQQGFAGQKILRERPQLSPILTNRDHLRKLPRDTLGRHYVDWADRENIYPEQLNCAVNEIFGIEENTERAYLINRLQLLHDLFHVVTGYGRDPGGEIALLAFCCEQEGNTTLGVLSKFGVLRCVLGGHADIIALVRDAKRRAKRAPLLLAQHWELLLEQPIAAVREELSLGDVPHYRKVIVPTNKLW